MTSELRLYSSSHERNREPIFEVLRDVLPPAGEVLEIAAGTGQHAADFARRLPSLRWQASEADTSLLPSIAAWREATRPHGVDGESDPLRAPLELDVTSRPWPVTRADAIVCINMIHIAPWECTLALFEGAADILPGGGVLYLYGPYRIDGRHTAPSNEAFDESLRARDVSWGVRDVADVTSAAARVGFEQSALVAMPGNNQSLVFRRSSRR